ncbi:putative late blight resistance proteinR1A-10 [Sesamum angolense]|uniref:Late blight resistance proteinR1A-10 n=1 Tax=Sesamum angolense TaxID=2727404 RepID=A0AAE2BR63_9LAMI|nr:putative late blight resistance proteinR1A-10 [Sesamum angolense]
MAVAAYAALLSLKHVLDNVQHPARRHRLHVDTERIQSLQEKVQFLQDFLELHSQRKSQEIDDLARKITVVADDAEDVIDLHVVDQLREGTQDESHHLAALSSFCQDLDRVIEKIDSITKGLMMIKEDWGDDVQEQKLITSFPASSSAELPFDGKNSSMVGFDDRLLQIMDELTRDESNFQILPIVGMGGIGSCEPYLMDFLDNEKSWDLLCKKVFGRRGCPYPELKECGKDIAKGCKGLPLTIVVISGLLAKSNMTREYWDSVAKNVNSFANSEDNERCLKILYLSYSNLSIHLKSCFLYMGAFREDKEIKVSELAKLWIAEGFLKPIRGKILEKVAEEYMKDLANRNMILIRTRTSTGKIRSCGIHDLLRDLCLKEFEKEHFIRVPKVQCIHLVRKKDVCFLCSKEDTLKRIYLLEVHVGSQTTSIAIPLVCDACRMMYPRIVKLRLVKLMDIFNDYELLQPTKLRHLKVEPISLPDPKVTQGSATVLENLQTLSKILNFRCTEEVLERIPNVKKLKVIYSDNSGAWSYYCLHNLAYLHKLESLSLTSSFVSLEDTAFPQSLKKLTLTRCRIPWDSMTVIGSLSNLEVLKLYYKAFQGPEWNPHEGQFPRLKVLYIHNTDLERWGAEDIHFPNLESLVLKTMFCLEEIPAGIGDIPTLRSIHLSDCTDSAVTSAKQIQKEQESNGNELEVCVESTLRLRQALERVRPPARPRQLRRYFGF